MAKPVVNENHPWIDARDSSELADHRVSMLTGYYQDGTKERLTIWRLGLWERVKVLLLGKVVFHCLETDLPLHKISTDYSHVRRMEGSWCGSREALNELDKAPFEIRVREVKKIFRKEHEVKEV